MPRKTAPPKSGWSRRINPRKPVTMTGGMKPTEKDRTIFLLLAEEVGQVKDQHHLGQLHGLKGHRAEVHPAPGAAGLDRKRRHQGQDQQGDDAKKPQVDLAVEQPARHPGEQDHDAEAGQGEQGLTLEEVVAVADEPFGHDAARGKDHDQAQAGQEQGGTEQPEIEGSLLFPAIASDRNGSAHAVSPSVFPVGERQIGEDFWNRGPGPCSPDRGRSWPWPGTAG